MLLLYLLLTVCLYECKLETAPDIPPRNGEDELDSRLLIENGTHDMPGKNKHLQGRQQAE